MYNLEYTGAVKKDFKRCARRNFNMNLLENALNILVATGTLPPQFLSHKLSNNYAAHWECHIKPDWLLIWLQDDIEQTITLVRTGTHSDLF